MNSPLASGTKLGRYEIRSPLGAGGMGEVYLVQDTKLDRKVALKIVPSEVAANPVKSDIAREVSHRLRSQLSGEDQRKLTKGVTENAEAISFT